MEEFAKTLELNRNDAEMLYPEPLFSRLNLMWPCPALLGLFLGLLTLSPFEEAAFANPVFLDGTTPGSLITGASDCASNCMIRSTTPNPGNYLLHSFQDFNVAPGVTVTFDSGGVMNTLTRVTGGNLSTIRGQLQLINGENFFLINPSGIHFEDAILDLSGSFTASTAESILFQTPISLPAPSLVTVNEYDATDNTSIFPPSVLPDITGISGLRFNSSPGKVDVIRLTLNSNGDPSIGRTLGFLGGPVTFDGTSFQLGNNWHLRLGGIGGADVVPITPTSDGWKFDDDSVSNFAEIALQNNSAIDLGTGFDSPVFQARAQSITLTNSQLRTLVSAGAGQPIRLRAEDEIILNSALIQSEVFGNVIGSDISLQAGDILLSNASEIQAIARDDSTGGNLIIRSLSDLNLDGDSVLRTVSNQNAQGGDIRLDIDNEVLLGSTLGGRGIIQATSNDNGGGGGVQIDTRQLTASEASEIQAIVNGSRAGGGITLRASGQAILEQQSKVLSIANQDALIGDISIQTGALSLDSSEISTRTLQKGGNIRLEASRQIQLDNGSLISAIGDATGGMQGGAITIVTPVLEALSESDNDVRARAQFDPLAAAEAIQFNPIDLSGVLSIINFNREPVVHTSALDNIQNALNQIDLDLPDPLPPANPPNPTLARLAQRAVTVSSPVPLPVPNNPQPSSGLQPSLSPQPNPQPRPNSQPNAQTSSATLSASPYLYPDTLSAVFDARLVNASNLFGERCKRDAMKGGQFVITGRGGLVPSPQLSLADEMPLEDLGPDLQPAFHSSLPLRVGSSGGLLADSLPAADLREVTRWRRNRLGQVQLMAIASRASSSQRTTPTCSGTRG